MQQYSSIANNYFLRGGGEMGERTNAFDWSHSPVGSIEEWPQSLRTTLGIVLNSKFPMILFWGPEQICFYNDAFRPSLGKDAKHPKILGMPSKDAWPETWAFTGKMIQNILLGGEATWHENQLVPIYRNGAIENVYWTFSYSPVYDDGESPAGVLVTCVETTRQVQNDEILRNTAEELAFAIDAAELATWDVEPATGKMTANQRMKDWFWVEVG